MNTPAPLQPPSPPGRTDLETLQQQFDRFATNDHMRQIVDAVPDMVVVLNRQRQIVYANQAFYDIPEIEQDEVVNGLRPGEALRCMHALSSRDGCGTTEFCRTCGALTAILSGLRGEETVQECRITRADGSALDLRVWATPLVVEDEMFTIFAVQDISNEKRRRILERLFFHDILNTAGILMGFAEILRDADAQELDLIKDQFYEFSRRLIDEINTQKTLSIAETDELVVDWQPVDSLALLEETSLFYSGHEVAQGRRLWIKPDAEAVMFTSDPTLLRRILGNLIKNALEASSPGEQVTLNTWGDNDQVVFCVHNEMVMPPDVRLQVFQRSFSTKGEGRGLGTYSVKLLTTRYLHGAVSFTSTAGKGTTFHVRFPRTTTP